MPAEAASVAGSSSRSRRPARRSKLAGTSAFVCWPASVLHCAKESIVVMVSHNSIQRCEQVKVSERVSADRKKADCNGAE